MVLEVEDAIEVYRDYAKFPSVSKGYISNSKAPGHVYIESVWSQRDLERGEAVKFSRGHIVQLDVVLPTAPQAIGTEQWNVESPSGKLRVVVRKVTNKKGEDQQFIEIWSNSNLLHNVDVESQEQHGKIYENGNFGCLEWSYSETHILYVAEKKRPKAKSFFDRKATRDIEGGNQDIVLGEEHEYVEPWGEQMTGKSHPVICVLDIDAGAVSTLDNVPDNISPGQAVWCPDDLGIVCVGWDHEPYRLGYIYCAMRRSDLYYIDLRTFQCSVLGGEGRSVRGPRFSPDLSKLLYLDNAIGGPHIQCARLMMIDWSTKGVVTVVDEVASATDSGFTGLYPALGATTLPVRCMANDSRRLIMGTQWRSKAVMVCIDCETGTVVKITDDPVVGGWQFLDIKDDLILAACSSPDMPPYLVIGQLPKAGHEETISWTMLDSDVNCLRDVTWRHLPMEVSKASINPDYESLDYECVLLEPLDTAKDGKKPPLIAFPHGGPHSVFGADFSLYFSGLCRCGYAVLLINYRGSTGFGANSINSLPGHIGTQDVQDCHAAVEKVLEMGVADPERVVVMGGSHGGFLTCHLIGQYPEFYKAAVARNPVTDLPSKAGTSDIPDWVFTEIGLPFDHVTTPNAEVYKMLHDASPIRYIDQMKTPLMLMIGAKDQRVPPRQSHTLRKALLARGVTVRTKCYADCEHPLTEVKSEADAFINIVQWFGEHISVKK